MVYAAACLPFGYTVISLDAFLSKSSLFRFQLAVKAADGSLILKANKENMSPMFETLHTLLMKTCVLLSKKSSTFYSWGLIYLGPQYSSLFAAELERKLLEISSTDDIN